MFMKKKAPTMNVGAAMKRMEKLLLDSKSFFKVLQLHIRLKILLLSINDNNYPYNLNSAAEIQKKINSIKKGLH